MANPASRPDRPPWITWAALGLCALAVWAVYGATRDFHFVVWDDDHNIQQNVHLSGVTWENLRWMFTDTAYARRYFPLTWLGWNIEHDLFGLTARSAHIGNVLFHLLNTVLVFLVIKSGLRLWSAKDHPPGEVSATVAATLGALLWALHPLRVEVIAWASGRIYAQTACFLLISTWCYLKSLEALPASSTARRSRWASVVAFALSLLTYPLALSFVGILLVLDWYRPNRPAAPGLPWHRQVWPMLVEKIPFIVVTAAMLGVTLWARTNTQAVGWKPPITLQEFGVVPRIMQACYVWVYYLGKPLLPFHLSPFYPRLVAFQPGDWEFVLSFCVVVAITGLLFWRRQRWPGLWLLWLCHLIVLTPMLGLTEHPHFTNDRYSYLSTVPWSVAVAVVIVRLWSHRTLRVAAVVVVGALIAFFSRLSVAQVAIWHDTETLGLHMIATMGDHPRRFDIYSRIATALRAEGKVAESNAYYLKYLSGDPHAADKVLDHARGLEARGQSREASIQYLIVAQLRPDLAEPRYRLGAILLAEDHAAEALPYLQEAVRLEPNLADAQTTLGWALNRTGQGVEALPHFEAALRQQPHDPAAHSGMGVALVALGRPEESIAHFAAVLQEIPDSAVAHFNLGTALEALGRLPDAAQQFAMVIKLQPDYPGAREALERTRR